MRPTPLFATQHIRAPAELRSQLDLLVRLKYRHLVAELSTMEDAATQVCTDPRSGVDGVGVVRSRDGSGSPPGTSPGGDARSPVAEEVSATALALVGRTGAEVEEPIPDGGDPVDTNLEIEDGEITLFEAAISAFHADEFQRAESLFLEEAQRNEVAPQRAAIAYRQAALAAGKAGRRDAADHWMRLAGREYLRVTEDDRTPLPFVREAAVMAAKCFLSVENLHVASKGLRRAQAIESVLRADEDLMTEVDAFPSEAPATAPSALDIVADQPVRPHVGPGADVAASTTEQASGRPSSEPGSIAPVRQPSWVRRRHHRPLRKTV